MPITGYILIGLVVTLVAISFLITTYYWVLCSIAILKRKKPVLLKGRRERLFSIVIPAHNEEGNIRESIESCLSVDYPPDKLKIYVVADNCTDKTADIARLYNVECLERRNNEFMGKGYALSWAFEKILSKHEAIVVLDADCTIDRDSLRIYSNYLDQGEKVLQANYAAKNADDNALSYILAVGLYIENALFYPAKAKVGLTSLLQGTGMVFDSEILKAHPWGSHSIVEDTEYSIQLVQNSIKIRFVDEVSVYADLPTSWEQVYTQRSRWVSGNVRMGRSHAISMIAGGIKKKSVVGIDAGITLLVLSKPAVLAISTSAAMLALFVDYYYEAAGYYLATASLANLLILVCYFLFGIIGFGVNRKRIGYLLKTPAILAGLIAITLKNSARPGGNVWERTPR